MKNKKRLTKYFNYTIVAWFFAIIAAIFEIIPLSLSLAKISIYNWVLILLMILGFLCILISLAMIIALHFDKKDKSIQEEIKTEITLDEQDEEKNDELGENKIEDDK